MTGSGGKSGGMFGRLPQSYRRAGVDGAAGAISAAADRAFADLERLTRQVLQSRFLDHANDLDDVSRLAALFQLGPWPEEELEPFRNRVRTMARLYLQGAATATGMLEALGAAFDLTLAAVTIPGSGGNDAFTTSAEYRLQGPDGGRTAVASVVDLPPVSRAQDVPLPEWSIANNLYGELPGYAPDGTFRPGAGMDPVVDIHAGGEPFALPVLVQHDLRRFILVNRLLPPGAAVRVDLTARTVTDIGAVPSWSGSLTLGGAAAPDLLFGSAGLTDDGTAGHLSGVDADAIAQRPYHLLRWNRNVRAEENLPEVPGEPGSMGQVPGDGLPWVPLVPIGQSRWSLQKGVGGSGEPPSIGIPSQAENLRVVPLDGTEAPLRVVFGWTGRRLGTFTIRFDPGQLWNGDPADAAEQARRESRAARGFGWLKEQVERLKLAGIVYLDQSELAPKLEAPAVPEAGTAEFVLWDRVEQTETLRVYAAFPTLAKTLAEKLVLQDAVTVEVTKE